LVVVLVDPRDLACGVFWWMVGFGDPCDDTVSVHRA